VGLKIKVKKLHPEAVVPNYAKEGDAGLDLASVTGGRSEGGYLEYGTGLSIEIPTGYVGLIFPRSSISTTNLLLSNCVGVVDSGYRGEIKFRFRVVDDHKWGVIYHRGDRIGQLIIIPYPQIELEEVTELSNTDRGEGGYGSSGR
jgi:dUTP pyrophosphatase